MLAILLCLIAISKVSQSTETCNIEIVESIPQSLTYESTSYIAPPIWKAWMDLIKTSTKYIRINSLYWSLLSNDTNTTDISTDKGTEIFKMLLLKSKRLPIQINHDIDNSTCRDIKIMEKYKNIKISLINVTRLIGHGIQHSKLMIGDGTKAFIGSANMDWRSLTQIKEIGAYITKCPELIRDLDAFWLSINLLTGPNANIPKTWPRNMWPKYNLTHPLSAYVNGVPMDLYTASSPPAFNPPHRSDDLIAIKTTIKEARKYILISVMDYVPLNIDYSGHHNTRFWPDIEDAIITAAIDRRVTIKMLISWWNYSDDATMFFLRSLVDLNMKLKHNLLATIEVKIFIIPAFNELQRNLPFARVSHSKYMVTDSTAYIGTSNWSGNYFTGTVGVSLVAKEKCGTRKCKAKSIRQTMEDVFFVDWNSIYAHSL